MPDETYRQSEFKPPKGPVKGPLMSDGGIEVQGNVPEEFKKVLAQKQKEKQQQQAKPSAPQAGPPNISPTPDEPPPAPVNPKEQQFKPAPNLGASMANTSDLQKLLEGLHVNYEPINLPSRGRFYEDEALKGGTLHVRPMTGAEEEILATPRHIKRNEAMDMIFNACIQEHCNTYNLLTVDRTYLLIWLRGISYSTKYEVEVECPRFGCETKFQTTIDLDHMNVDYCPDSFTTAKLSGTLPKSGYQFSYRLATGADDLAVNEYRERRLRRFGDQAADNTLTFRTALLLNNIETITDNDELQVLLKRLPVEDVAYLRNLASEPPFGVDTNVDCFCPACTNEFSLDLPLEAGFFFPRSKTNQEE